MDVSIADIEQSILDAIAADALTLPTLPDVALEVKTVAADPKSSMDDLVAVISTDAAVSARMLKVANSPLMRRAANDITDLHSAVTHMGMKYASNLALGVAMAQMFRSDNEMLNQQLQATWQLSSEVAGLCKAFCQFNTRLEPSVALLAGLVHRIGVLPVLSFAEDRPGLASDEALLQEAMESLHCSLGGKILRQWGFTEELVNACETYLDFEREKEAPDYADLVTVAVLEKHDGSSHSLADVDHNSVKAYARLNMSPDSGGVGAVEISGTASDAAWAMGE